MCSGPQPWVRGAWRTLAESGAITQYGALTMPAGRVEELPRSSDTPDVRMLPAYDDCLIGHRTRETSVPSPHQARVRPGGGLVRPTVIADGLVIATWARGPGSRSLQVDAFEPLPSRIEQGVDREKESVVGFLRPLRAPDAVDLDDDDDGQEE
ncbi:DNA glycosylase AlkZ-like family protein [Streptomyces sp. NPDC101213]|uniref:DNA glycosylase AlkZ-like family protein n=1 Tax=Streptomyces sp. NPDC101213 TaxID=3366130 RepID=UPI00380187A1